MCERANDSEKVAMVGDKKWEEWLTGLYLPGLVMGRSHGRLSYCSLCLKRRLEGF